MLCKSFESVHGLPDGHTRAVTTTPPSSPSDPPSTGGPPAIVDDPSGLQALLNRSAAAQIPVARRPLAAYDLAAGLAAGLDTANTTGIAGVN